MEFGRREDTVVEGEDGELGEADAEVVEMAEDVIALVVDIVSELPDFLFPFLAFSIGIPSPLYSGYSRVIFTYLSEHEKILIGDSVDVPAQSMRCSVRQPYRACCHSHSRRTYHEVVIIGQSTGARFGELHP